MCHLIFKIVKLVIIVAIDNALAARETIVKQIGVDDCAQLRRQTGQRCHVFLVIVVHSGH